MRMHVLPSALLAGLLAAIAAPAQAADDDLASIAVEGEAKLVTDQRTRAISDSLRQPGVMLGVQVAHESGLIGLAQVMSTSRKYYTNSDGYYALLAGGYRFGNPDGWHFGLGLATEIFPGARFDAPHGFDMATGTPTDFRTTKYDTSYAVAEIGWGALEGRVLNVLSKAYRGADTGGVCGQMLAFMADPTRALECYARGDHNARGSWLFDLDYRHALGPRTTLKLHAGYQKVNHFSEANFADVAVGVTHKAWGVEWTADWMKANTRVRELYQALDGTEVKAADKAAVVLSASYKF
jgi:hypothetical protein